MKPIVLCGLSLLFGLVFIRCESNSAEQARGTSVKRPGSDSLALIDTVAILMDTGVASLHQDDPAESAKSLGEKNGNKQPANLPNNSNEPRRFYVMDPRTFDSLISTEGAVVRLHPEDRALYYRRSRSGKLRLPKLDPVTHRPLPFPYSFPDVYAADIRRLDSIKAAQSPKPPSARPHSSRHP